MFKKLLLAATAVGAGTLVQAAPVTYTMDPAHTFPSFEAPHGEQMSIWRGKFNKSSGKVMLDKQAKTGTVEVTVDTSSVDFGFDAMNKVALGPDYFNVEKYPTATYKGTILFKGDKPAKIKGQFTLLGITKPLDLEKLKAFKCMQNPVFKREICGADAYAEFNRGDFGMTQNKNYGLMVTLRIAVEAMEGDQPPGPPPGYKPPAP